VRVVLDVDRERADCLLVAMRLVLLVDLPVAVPVVDDRLAAVARRCDGGRGRDENPTRYEQGAADDGRDEAVSGGKHHSVESPGRA
jgi:hypothetical protein